MRNNKLFLLILGLVFFCATVNAQEGEFTSLPSRHGTYSLVAYISGGAGYFASTKGYPGYLHANVRRVNPVSTIRILWHPDHLLKGGVETGYITFYAYSMRDSSGNKGKVALNATPVLLVWSMSVTRHFNIFAGSGAYFLNSHLDYLGKTVSKKFAVGWMAAASYIVPLSKNAGLGAETKWLYAAETSNGSICLQVQFVWKFMKW